MIFNINFFRSGKNSNGFFNLSFFLYYMNNFKKKKKILYPYFFQIYQKQNKIYLSENMINCYK